jgi:WD40 repeat protein
VITGGFDRVIRIARRDLARPLVTLDAADAIEDLIPNAAGTRVVSIGHDGTIELWDTSHLREPVVAAQLRSPIGRIVIGRTGTTAWLPASGSKVAILDAKQALVAMMPGWPIGYRPGSDDVVLNDGGKLFVYSITGAQLQALSDPSSIQTAAFSPSGNVLATSSANHITLRDARTWAITGGLDTHRDDTTAIALDDAGHVVTGHNNGDLISWTATGKQFGGHSAHVEDIAIRGDRVLSASWDRTTRAWGLGGESRGVVLPSYGHALSLSPSGKLLATIDHSTVSIWDALGGRLLEELPATTPLDSLVFADEDHVVVGGDNGTLEVIDLSERERSTAELVRLAGAMRH